MEQLIHRAIRERRLIEFTLHGLLRIVEPHVYGVRNGSSQLLVFQVAGRSHSGGLPDWRRVDVAEIEGLRLLDEVFARRPVLREPRGGWDVILARVE